LSIFSLRAFLNFSALNAYRRGLISELKLKSNVGTTLVRVARLCGDIVTRRFVVSHRNAINIGTRKNSMLLRTIVPILRANLPSLLTPVLSLDFLTARKIFTYMGIVMTYSRIPQRDNPMLS